MNNLTNLSEWGISGNQLSGCVPAAWRSEWGWGSDLEILGLSYCDAPSSPHLVAADRETLIALYRSANGDNWIINSNWLSDAPLNTWYGVTIDDSGRVTKLELGYNGLSGAIPSEIGTLGHLERLFLHGNALRGEIPSELGTLVNLTNLSLSENQLHGTIPQELGNLTNLDMAYLSGNRLGRCLPASWQDIETNDFDELGLVSCNASLPSLTAVTDEDALIALYRGTDGDYWIDNSNWLSYAPLNTWYGVTTDEDGRVIRLDLRENGLWGTIPSELGNLTKLQGLSLADNQLDGTIPSELGNLINLEWLTLDSNQLCGTIPPELGNLINLEVLYLDSNQLQGTVPPELNNLTNLSEWGLSGNQLSGCVPSAWWSEGWSDWENDWEILGLPYCAAPSSPLTVAALAAFYRSANGENWTHKDNWLSDAPLNTWYGVTTDKSGRVTGLELPYNGLSGTLAPELGTLGHLERLLLHGNTLRGAIPPELGNLSRLTRLSLWNNRLDGIIPSELGKLTNLEWLYLDSNQLRGTVPPELGNLTNLAVLWLDSNQLHGKIPPELGNLTNLLGLSLSRNQLSGCVPAAWRNVVESDLEEIGLPYCVAS